MAKLTKPPDQQGFSIEEQAQVAHRALPGGLSWRRLDVVGGATRFYDVAWVTGREGFLYLSDFYDENVGRNAEVFQVDLFGPTATLVEVDAHFVPGSFRLESVTGHEFTVRAKLEALPFPGEPSTWPPAWSDFFLELTPDQANYSAEPGTEVARIQHDGPSGRYRRSVLNSARRVSVLWYCDAAEYALLQRAYLAWVAAGGQAFVMELILQSPDLVAHTCSFIPGSFRMTSVQEQTYTVQAELEVQPTPYEVDVRPYVGANFGEAVDPYVPPGSATEIAWYDAIGDRLTGTLNHANSGTGVCDSYAPGPVLQLYAGVVGYTDETIVWSISWSTVEDVSPSITDAAAGWVEITWCNLDGTPAPIDFASIGTLTLTATINGVPIAEGQRLVAVTTSVTLDYPDIAWGPE